MVISVERVGEVIASAAARGHRRVPRAAAGLPRLLRLARPGAGDRGRRHADHVADADPGGRLAARPVRVLAVEGVAAPAEGAPSSRRLGGAGRPPAGAGRGRLRAAAGRAGRRRASSYKADYDFSAGFPQDTESAQAAADLQRAFAAGALAPTEVYLTTTDGSPLDRRADRRVRRGRRRARPASARRRPPERGHGPERRPGQPAAGPQPVLERGHRPGPRRPARRRARGRARRAPRRRGRRHDRDLRRHQLGEQPRPVGDPAGGGGADRAHPGAAAAQPRRADLPGDRGAAELRRHARRHRVRLPGHPGRARASRSSCRSSCTCSWWRSAPTTTS